jgi:hypothetical protein
MNEILGAIETAEPIELGDETLDLVGGGAMPEFDPNG